MRAFFANYLPDNLKTQFKSMLGALDLKFLGIVARYPSLAIVYYCINGRFSAQMRAGVAGRRAFSTMNNTSNAPLGFLRRHIHRLEKGLIMQPRKPLFALDYIAQTVAVLDDCLAQGHLSHADSQWAYDVLSEYFAVVEEHPALLEVKHKFAHLSSQYSLTPADSVPYPAAHRDGAVVSFQDFSHLCQQRRSVRYFADTLVEDEKLTRAIQLALTAPSACNRQSFKFISFNTPEDAQRVGAIAAGTAGFAQQFQSLFVLVGDLSAYPFEKDRHVIYIDGALASMQLMLALETLGLSSCPINWADEPVAEARMQAELQLPSYQRVIMLIAVGYAQPDGMIAYSAKRPVSELLDKR